jgi:N-dimethylarginine dimethylaminohydrolase
MSEVRDKILMCAPDYFSINYVINPWMTEHIGSSDQKKAKKQWSILKDVISEYADVVTVEPRPGLPDMVFTANAGLVVDQKVIPSHFIPLERRPEEQYFKHWFKKNSFKCFELNEQIKFEGAGDCLLDKGGSWLWTGVGFRTEIEAHVEIERFFGIKVVALQLVDPHFYHIDTCFCPLTGGFVMYYPPAFNSESRLAIEDRIPLHKRIIVNTMDAENFACNAINIGNVIILNKASGSLKSKLINAGFKIREVDLSEFLKAGGSAKCLTLKLTESEKF